MAIFDIIDFIRLIGIHRASAKNALQLEMPMAKDVLFKISDELELALTATMVFKANRYIIWYYGQL